MFATEGLKPKDPCPHPWILRVFKVKENRLWKFQGFSRTRVPKKFQGFKFFDLEIPWSSRQGWGICFQGFFFNFKEKYWLSIKELSRIFKEYLETLEVYIRIDCLLSLVSLHCLVSLVSLASLISLVRLISLVGLVKLNKRNKINKPNNLN